MANLPWPATLPQRPLVEGYSNVLRDPTVSSPMGYGPAKRRRRTQVPLRDVNMVVEVTDAQLQTLESFYQTDLECVNPFDWIDHQNADAATTYVFAAAPAPTPIGAGWWRVQMALEHQGDVVV